MSKHTPEPWTVKSSVHRPPEIWSEEAFECISDRIFNDNADRIVACVNACAGMELEDVKRIPAMLAQYELLCRKVTHGCTGALCSACDSEPKPGENL